MRLIGMKASPVREVYYYLQLETMEELDLYFQKFEGEFSSLLSALLKSDYPVNRWDHAQVEGVASAAFYTAITQMKMHDVSPFDAMGAMSELKRNTFVETFKRFGSICVDFKMGTCRPPFTEDEIVVSNEQVDALNIPEADYSEI